VPYACPGAELTRAVRKAVGPRRDIRVLVLANHGTVVTGASPNEVRGLLDEVEARLKLPVRSAESKAPGTLPELPGYVPASEPSMHALALDGGLFDTVSRGTIVPDQVVFLGGPVPDLKGLSADVAPPSILIRGVGTLARAALPEAARPMLRGLYDIALRAPENPLTYLEAGAVEALRPMEAEKSRQSIAR
jgi:rhamnose utilization protein RhaD (predicted bifunctional aldolase and dehydrogenase)